MPKVVLKDVDDNVSEAEVDGIVMIKGDTPVDLTDDQIKRLKEAGAKLDTDPPDDAGDDLAKRLEAMNLEQLRQEAAARNLPTGGNKIELTGRILNTDTES